VQEWLECAPCRDFARPAPYRHVGQIIPIPIGPALHALLIRSESVEGFRDLTSHLLACMSIVLARHAQVELLTVGLATCTDTNSVLPITSRWSPHQPFAAYARGLAEQIPPDTPRRLGPGCVLKTDRGPVPVVVEMYRGGQSADRAQTGTEPHAEITLKCVVDAGKPTLDIEYNALLYRNTGLTPFARQLAFVLDTAIGEPSLPIGQLPLQNAEETHRLRHRFNCERCASPIDRTLADLIEEQVRHTPDSICCVHGHLSLSFQALNSRANQVARLLLNLGVGPGSFVSILQPRSLSFVIGMLAIWKAGAAYVPVDPQYPEQRVRHMLVDSAAKAVLADAASLNEYEPLLRELAGRTAIVRLDEEEISTEDTLGSYGPGSYLSLATHDLPAHACARDAAYMIYTSGTTGQPKGTIVRHDGAINHIFAQAHSLGTDGIRDFLQSAPSSSDISVWQFACPLVFGGKTVILDDARDIEEVVRQVRAHGLRIIELVPTVLKYLISYLQSLSAADRALPNLRWMMVTGESVPVDLVNAWLGTCPHIPVVNAYGPTEASDDVAQEIIRAPLPPNQLRVPIGHPLANLDIYILDDALEPVPLGAPGEICVSGVGVGAGYWNNPQKTQACFVPNPFPDAQGDTIYRTGDMGRTLEDGTIEYLGRRDQQVQFRGFRIELGEIEAILRLHPAVEQAVANVYFEDDRDDDRLVAYVVPKAGHACHETELKGFLTGRLPKALVPTSVILLPGLPLTPAGKLDRKALPAPSRSPGPQTTSGNHPARNDNETRMLRIWQTELGNNAFGIHDDFFALGGDSLTAIGIVAAGRAEGLHIRPSNIFRFPTVASLCSAMDPVAPQVHRAPDPTLTMPPIPELTPQQREQVLRAEPAYEDAYPVTPTQQGIYLQSLLSHDKSIYVDQYCYGLEGPLNHEAFRKGWEWAVAHHEVARAGFVRRHHGRLLQVVHREAILPFELVDLSALPESDQEAALQTLRQAEVDRGFALERAPLMRTTLVRLAVERHILIWTHHHLILDGWSLTLFLRSVLDAYRAILAQSHPTPSVDRSFRAYIEWLQRQDITPAEGFWKALLAGGPDSAPLRLPQPLDSETGFGEQDLVLATPLVQSLADFARSEGLTTSTVLQAGWAILLARLSSADQVRFGTVTSGRQVACPAIKTTVGMLVTTLPFQTRVPPGKQVDKAWLHHVQRTMLDMREHEITPLATIRRWLAHPANQPLFETLFVMANFPHPEGGAPGGLTLSSREYRTVPPYLMTLIASLEPTPRVRLVYDRRRLDQGAATRLLRDYGAILSEAVQVRMPQGESRPAMIAY
jgi:amino acid adenylation domain-containing protein